MTKSFKRDQKKFGPMLEAAMPYVRGTMFKILRHRSDMVDDVIQSAAMRAWQYRHQFRGESKFTTWFMRIAVNEALMYLRRTKVKEDRCVSIDAKIESSSGFEDFSALIETIEDLHLDPEQYLIAKRYRESIAREIKRMSPIIRQAILLRGVEELTMPEVAKAIGAHINTAKARTHRARVQIREALNREAV